MTETHEFLTADDLIALGFVTDISARTLRRRIREREPKPPIPPLTVCDFVDGIYLWDKTTVLKFLRNELQAGSMWQPFDSENSVPTQDLPRHLQLVDQELLSNSAALKMYGRSRYHLNKVARSSAVEPVHVAGRQPIWTQSDVETICVNDFNTYLDIARLKAAKLKKQANWVDVNQTQLLITGKIGFHLTREIGKHIRYIRGRPATGPEFITTPKKIASILHDLYFCDDRLTAPTDSMKSALSESLPKSFSQDKELSRHAYRQSPPNILIQLPDGCPFGRRRRNVKRTMRALGYGLDFN